MREKLMAAIAAAGYEPFEFRIPFVTPEESAGVVAVRGDDQSAIVVALVRAAEDADSAASIVMGAHAMCTSEEVVLFWPAVTFEGEAK